MERYREIIPDYERFLDSLNQPPPAYLRVNWLKISTPELKELLREEGVYTEEVEWSARVLKHTGGKNPAKTIYHWLGLFYIQDIASELVVEVLQPRPHELVLDLCAAPGGKTTAIAEMTEDTATIIANDIGSKRLRALQSNIIRMGLSSVVVTSHDAIRFPPVPQPPHRILVDVPCSAEGQARESSRLKRGAEPGYIFSISGTQKGILRRACQLAAPGTIIVYSTCTFAPEENEFVVAYVLEREAVELVPIEAWFPCSRGITQWNGKKLPPEVEGCIRIYPHQLDSGGMFIACLKKL